MSASALPFAHERDRRAADSWLYAVSTISNAAMSSPYCFATASIRAFGPTRIGVISPIAAASTAPRSELSSQGCATATGVGGSALQ